MKSFDQQVADWAATKPAGEGYDFGHTCRCALGQFLMECGVTENPVVGMDYWRVAGSTQVNDLTDRLSNALEAKPRTFGALAARLRDG